MYVFGVLLSAYYNWWSEITAKRPLIWAAGLGASGTVISLGLAFLPAIWIVIIYPLLAFAIVPAYFAASKNGSALAERRSNDQAKIRRIQQLIEMGRNR